LPPHHYVVPLHDVVPRVPFRPKKKLLMQPPLAISTETKALATAWYSESPELQEDRIPDRYPFLKGEDICILPFSIK
jgi:hypothetical protein